MSRDQPRERWFDQGPGPKRRFDDERAWEHDRDQSFCREKGEDEAREWMQKDRYRGEAEGSRVRQGYEEGRGQDRDGNFYNRRPTEQRAYDQGW